MPRELATDLSVLERLVKLDQVDVVDVGCGGGALVRALAARGARPVGIEISAEQLASALALDDGGARYLVGRAEALPLADSSADVVVFMRSLHHVPATELTASLREARRVLRPGGVVYVAEPLAEGDYFALTSLVEEELEVRQAAQRAIADAAHAGLERRESIEYDVRVCVADLVALRARFVSVDPRRAELFDARQDELADAFARLGVAGESPGERCFIQPMRADLLADGAHGAEPQRVGSDV